MKQPGVPRALAIYRATQKCEGLLARLRDELAKGTVRLYLDPLVELFEIHVPGTGGTLVTQSLKAQLGELRPHIEARPYVQEAPPARRAAPPCPPHTEMSCLHCGTRGELFVNGGGFYEARCPQCVDGDPEATGIHACRGMAHSPEEAEAEWIDSQEHALPPWYWTTNIDRQIAAEAHRQASWIRTETDRGVVWAPAAE